MKSTRLTLLLQCALSILVFTSTVVHAQTDAESDLDALVQSVRSDVTAVKKATLNQIMKLEADEDEAFWPIYDAYDAEMGLWAGKKLAVLRGVLERQAAGGMSKRDWNDLADEWIENQEDRIKLWEKYYKKISRSVSPFRGAQFLQVEHQMSLLVDLSVSSELPVLTEASSDDIREALSSAPDRAEMLLVTVVAEVEAIDYDTRVVTLRGGLGNSITFTADESVKRLGDVDVGDTVRADYFISVAAELRAPTPAERQEPLVIVEGAGRAPDASDPGAGGLRLIKAVCTIEGLDRPTETVTIKGPLGRYSTIRAADPANLSKVRIGETVVITYTEALAISLEKVVPAKN